jgi:two-component system, OmpR family, response regulator MtrA
MTTNAAAPAACIWLADAIERDLVKMVIRRVGLDPMVCFDRDELLAAISQHQPRLVVLDVVLPGANGLDLAKAIKMDGKDAVPLIAIISSLAFPEVIARARQAGADEFFVKPINSDLLFTRLSHQIKKSLSAGV